MYLSTNLLFLRKKSGMTQADMAKIFGLTRGAIYLYESGEREPSLKNLIKIAHYFLVNVDDLLLKDLRPQGSVLVRNLKYLRDREGIKQEDMAELLKVSKPNMSKYESGATEPNLQFLIRTSELFSVTIDDLLKRDLSKEAEESC